MTDTTAMLVATAFGPIAAVLITLWHQDRRIKIEAKERLFVTLMAHRKSFPLHPDWARGLNLIDVIYAGHPTVIAAWRDLYEYLSNVRPTEVRQVDHKRMTLLSSMARVLGYPLEQVDIDRYYVPEVHANEGVRNLELQVELLRVLKATERLSTEPRKVPEINA